MEDDGDIEALRSSIARVLDGECGSLALHAHIDGETRLDRMLWTRASELGWQAIGLPSAFGGLGLGVTGLGALHRELGRRAAPGPFAASLSAAQVLGELADDDIRAHWLPRLAEGACSLAVPARIDSAKATGDLWLLGAEDAAAALVPLGDDAWGLVTFARQEQIDLWDRTRTIFRAVPDRTRPLARLPAEAAKRSLTRHLSLALASDSIGGARALLEQTIAYMAERQQFGRQIASFQALKHRVADLMTAIVAGEEVVTLATGKAAEGDADADLWAWLAKAHATDAFVHSASDCLQLHGGVGYTWEFDVHLHLKRARLSQTLIAANTDMRDWAAADLAAATRSGRQPLGLAV